MFFEIGERIVSNLSIDGEYIKCTIVRSPRKSENGQTAVFHGKELIALEAANLSAFEISKAIQAYRDAENEAKKVWDY